MVELIQPVFLNRKRRTVNSPPWKHTRKDMKSIRLNFIITHTEGGNKMYIITFGNQEMRFEDKHEPYIWSVATQLFEASDMADNKEELKVEVRWVNDEE